jgi:tetratricopeptide (TPR) repeat protein
MKYAPLLWALCTALTLGCQSSTLTAAKLYLKQDQPEKAKDQLIAALDVEPQNAEAHFLLGKIYGAEGQYDEMVKSFARSLELGPKFEVEIGQLRHNYWAREYNSGVSYAQGDLPDFDKALRGFKNATLIDGERLEAWRNLAYVYYQMESVEDAIATYEHITAQAADDANSFYSLGVLYLNERRYEDAAQVLGTLVEIDPQHVEGYINRAVAQVNLEDFSGAEESYKQAIAIDPQAANPHYNLGNLYWQQKDYTKALEGYAKAVELDPTDEDALYNLAITHLALVDMDSALPLLEQLSVRMPDNAAVWRELGRIYAVKGLIEKSKNAYDREQALSQ